MILAEFDRHVLWHNILYFFWLKNRLLVYCPKCKLRQSEDDGNGYNKQSCNRCGYLIWDNRDLY